MLISNNDQVLTKRVYNSDETVLWEGSSNGDNVITLSESMNNFESIKIIFNSFPANTAQSKEIKEFIYEENKTIVAITGYTTANTLNIFKTTFNMLETSITPVGHYYFNGSFTAVDKITNLYVYKVVGINRKEGN